MRISAFPKCSIWLLCLSWTVTIFAQKLPNIQENSQWLPATAKADGKLSEWGDVMQAFNKATGIEYTIANDGKNLYLAIRSKDKGTTAKIMVGGVTFMVNSAGKSVNEGSAITFPVTKSGYTQEGFPNYRLLLDSAAVQNAILPLKEIKVFRLKGVSDSLLSIYNEYNIKSKLTYTKGELIYELLIPFDLIGLSSQSPAVAYSIKINGVTPWAQQDPSAPPPPVFKGRDPAIVERAQINTQVQFPTDFSGKYTLSKK